MIRAFSALCLFSLILLPRPARACQCMLSLSACREVGASDLVFIGTVESIEPMFLNHWNSTSPASIQSLNAAYTVAREHPSAEALARLKDTYLKTFPELAGDEKNQVQGAKTISDVTSLFYSSVAHGMRVRFRVKTLFKHEDDDAPNAPSKNAAAKDKAKATKDDDDDRKKAGDDFFEVETAFGECGYSFQLGETYLVYADSDEDSNVLSTSSCTRTRRLSDAGEDLTYLLVYKDRPEESTRLEGFTTTDEYYQLGFDNMHDPETTKAPVAGVIVELQSDRLTRYAESDSKGRFVFDGLRAGDYKVSAFARGYPVETRLLAGPQAFHITPKSCARQVLLLPKKEGN
jgi:hypothetical protein